MNFCERSAHAIKKAQHEFGRRHERVKADLRKLARSLESGAALPSRPKLLHDLRVARATLTRAVQALEAEGILAVRPRLGGLHHAACPTFNRGVRPILRTIQSRPV
ncbi:MAG: GntR family transcriptional regulator [Phycisphaerae bacterium]|nr:GntR family transcriptional regulator [Phycisphaerae bacterium]